MKMMNYLKSLALAVLALMAMNVSAANVDAAAARARALQFMMTQPAGKFMSPATDLQLVHAEASSVNAKLTDFYVFNLSDGSAFLIVSGEDRAEQVLAFGDRAISDYNRLPANMLWFLGRYKEQIEFLQRNPHVQVTRDSEMLRGSFKAATVSPLLGYIEWDQEAPYYNQTPIYRNQHTLTGCVATAMAQVMMYWKYPAELPALPAYTTETQRLSVPALPGTTLDWAGMLEQYYGVNYSTAQATAVATLMRYCGQSCWMDYDIASNGGSGAYCEDQLTGMKTFGYNSGASDLMRDDYSASNWNAMMQSDLAAGRPILYAGDDTRGYGGHAFVVDGYDAGTSKYHINWGWSGDGNCYCALDAFNVDGYRFNSWVEMLYEVYPEGSAIEKHAPVIGTATSVGTTSFTANWTDQTPAENVKDYTLYVNAVGAVESLLTETFAGVDVSSDGSADVSGSLNDYCDNQGWTGYAVYLAPGGLKMGSSNKTGYITSPAVDLSGSDGTVTVKFSAKYYSTDNSSVVVSCGDVQQTVALTGSAADYTVVLEGCDARVAQNITLCCTGSRKRVYIYSVEILSGNASTRLAASESGDADHRVITGIKSKNYTVTGLTAGQTYKYYVVANYTDNTNKASDKAIVTLLSDGPAAPEMIVDPEGLTMSTTVGVPVTATFSVLASDLTGDVNVTLSAGDGSFSVNPAVISIADAERGAAVTVTYNPAAAGTHTAVVTLSSEGAEDVTVAVNGTAALAKGALEMLPADEEYVTSSSFRADWTDETPAANVASYTLHVNKKAQAGNTLLTETFAGVDVASDGSQDRGASLDDYCDNAGWTGYAAYEAATGGFKLGSGTKIGYLVTPALDLGSTVTVKVNANYYGSDGSLLAVSCGAATDTIALTGEAADYTITLTGIDAVEAQNVTLSCVANKKRVYIHNVTIINGTAALTASETGDADSRVVTGITDKYYVVSGLTAGATYEYKVKAVYVDETESEWSNLEEVTLPSGGHGFELGDIDHSGNVDPADISALIDYLLNGIDICLICADVDGSGNVDPADISALIDYLLNN